MMNILGKLSSLFKIELNLPKVLNAKLFSDNQSNKTIYVDKRTININVCKLNTSKESKLKPLINQAIVEDGLLLTRDDVQEVITAFRKVDKEKRNLEFLKFIKQIIPEEDLVILRAAIFIKSQYDAGKDIKPLKGQLIERYGNRGKNISNLYSAGYFASLIKPLYEEMSKQPDFVQERFREVYEIIVKESPYAVFINTNMTPSETKEAVVNRIKISQKYGLSFLHIHGIGKENVSKILQLLDEMKTDFIRSPGITQGGNYIIAKIWLR